MIHKPRRQFLRANLDTHGLSDDPDSWHDIRDEQEVDEAEANLISSRVVLDPAASWELADVPGGWHMPALDIDVPHELVPSSTDGHGHLYFNVRCRWGDYVGLLCAMEKCGILEPGYVAASLERGATYLRKPGVTKDGNGPAPQA